jgi:hypothetical protein
MGCPTRERERGGKVNRELVELITMVLTLLFCVGPLVMVLLWVHEGEDK